MKKMILLLVLGLVTTVVTYAQPGNFPRRTVEERVAAVHAKLDSAFKLEAPKMADVDSVFAEYYKAQDKIREELFASGERPDRETMQAKMQPTLDARNEKLKKLLTEEQFKIWTEQIEPSMRRPPRQ